jgi:RHS repeat-associated protein
VISYYEADGLGTITSLSGPGGVLRGTYQYDSFGVPKSSTDRTNSYRYTARQLDPETGLYYYRARYYDPSIGRFLSEDPIGFDSGVNFYPYVGNKPIQFKDPNGTDLLSATTNFAEGVAIGAALTVVVSAAIASGTVIGGAIAVGAVGYGAYQGTIALQELILGIDPYTGAPLTTEQRIDVGAGLAGGFVGGGLALRPREFWVGDRCRIAPLGNRRGHPTGELPHYHRGVPDPARPGQSLPDQGMRRHRPWDSRPGDASFWDRF